jgi:hypothetical protein
MRKLIFTLIFSLSLFAVRPAFAYPAAGVTNNEIILRFPESATFRVTLTGEAEITSRAQSRSAQSRQLEGGK